MYHHQILTRDSSEPIKKIYLKQKVNYVKGDWFQLLLKDFEFIERDMNKKEISEMSKDSYKKIVKELMNKVVFKFFMNIKQTHSKLDGVQSHSSKDNFFKDKQE